MGKKFNGDLLHNLVAGQPNTNTEVGNTEKSNTEVGNTIATEKKRMKTSYSIDKDINLKLKFIALKDNTSVSDLVEKALYNLISNWEKKNGATPNL